MTRPHEPTITVSALVGMVTAPTAEHVKRVNLFVGSKGVEPFNDSRGKIYQKPQLPHLVATYPTPHPFGELKKNTIMSKELFISFYSPSSCYLIYMIASLVCRPKDRCCVAYRVLGVLPC